MRTLGKMTHWNDKFMNIAGAILFLVFLGALVAGTELPVVVWLYYLAASVITYLIYVADKSAARKNVSRISEKNLHALALLGGWPGAIVAQQTLRHKSAKASFRAVFWTTVVLNCGILAWLFTDSGAAFLRSVTEGLG